MREQARAAGGGALPGALFCVPLLVKDNIDVAGWATTAGAAAFLDNLPQQDAQQVPGRCAASLSHATRASKYAVGRREAVGTAIATAIF
jgi:hypothetical protein